jgi:Family of unknown function (DUF6263)
MRVLLIGLTVLATQACKPAIILRYDAEKIKTQSEYKYKRTQITEMTLSVKDDVNETIETEVYYYVFTPKKVQPDGSINWEMLNSRRQNHEVGNGVTTSYDTDEPVDSSIVESVVASMVINIPLGFVAKPDGSVSNVTGTDVVWDKLSTYLSNEPGSEAMLGQFKNQFGADFYTTDLDELWHLYPSKPVRKNEKWTSPLDYKSLNLKGKATHRINSVTPTQVEIGSIYQYRYDPQKPGIMNLGPVSITFKMNGDGQKTSLMDRSTGLILSSKSKVVFKGEMDIKVPFAGSQTIPAHLDLSSEFMQVK